MERASAEFGINPRTLSARMKQLSVLPADDGKYSTKEIARAVFGDLEMERIRKTSAEADQIEMENKTKAGELIDVAEFAKDYEAAALAVVRIVKSSKLTEDAQNEILQAMHDAHA